MLRFVYRLINTQNFALARSFVAVAVAFVAGCGSQEPNYINHQGATMGTYWRLSHDLTCNIDDVSIQRELDGLNHIFSTYDPESELSLINAAPAGEWVPTSDHLHTVMVQAQQTWQATGGAFDITIGPLVNLWGFGAEENLSEIPSKESQVLAANQVGMQYVQLGQHQLKKNLANLYLDLSALAKGYAVDVVAEKVSQSGCNNFMVDIGGEIRVHGVNKKAVSWRLGIESPALDSRGVQQVVGLSGQSIATSGDYRNFKWVNGRRVDHILDPRIGKPTKNSVASVTVIHPQAMVADAYATALMVLGYEAGLALAHEQSLGVYFIVHSGAEETENLGGPVDINSANALLWQTHYNEAMQNYFVD